MRRCKAKSAHWQKLPYTIINNGKTWRMEPHPQDRALGVMVPRKTMAEAGKAFRSFIALAMLLAVGLVRAELAGPVVAILDGDTIDVLIDRQPVRVRLAQIDAPEKRQAFGTRARQALAAMVFQKRVTVAEAGRDRYGRVLGTVFISSQNINAAMVEQGMAWVYQQYAKDQVLFALEVDARKHGRGLWVDANPVPPWEFRRLKFATTH